MLFVGSCFADNIGRRFQQEQFRAVVNPYGVMYNPASILHTVQSFFNNNSSLVTNQLSIINCPLSIINVAVLTLGTNHVYILKETGEIVDNCRKQPQSLFIERQLSVDECASYLRQTIALLREANPQVHVILTVSPIRYRKYGYHGSQLSKATLLLAADRVANELGVDYFPSYEIMNDELRDYRFYAPDMLHPSDQAVEYIYQRLAETYFSPATHDFLRLWQPIRQALAHRPFDPDSADYQQFRQHTLQQLEALRQQYPDMPIINNPIEL